jgi:hypothetical protein
MELLINKRDFFRNVPFPVHRWAYVWSLIELLPILLSKVIELVVEIIPNPYRRLMDLYE